MTRLQLATLEVSGLVAEIECEVQRADQVQDRLKDIQATRTTSQTILGVIFGGLANILSGGIGMATGAGDAGNIVSVAGGALEVLFGTSANFTKVRQEFSHPRNHLAAVWDGAPQSEFFSQRAWRFLTEPGSQPGPSRAQFERRHAADLAGRGEAWRAGIGLREKADRIAVRVRRRLR